MKRPILVLSIFMTLLCAAAQAQGGSQTITIRPGWNAVFLEIQPEPNECATVFSSAPFVGNEISRVAMWTGDELGAQFISDPATLTPQSEGWLLHFPNASFGSSVPTLKVLQGGRAYLIKSDASVNRTWTITGTPIARTLRWKADAYNFTGFYVGTPPTVDKFFAASPAHTGQPVYRMTATGAWQKVANPSTDTLARGEAYWVFTQGASQYQGPLRITLTQGGVLDFGKSTDEITMSIRYESNAVPTEPANKVTCTITPQILGGTSIPLKYWDPNVASGTFSWTTLPGTGWSFTLAPQEEKTIRWQVTRSGLPVDGTHPLGTRFENLLRIVGSGTPLGTGTVSSDVPVFAQTVAQPRAGLWAGDAVITAVSEHVGTTARSAPTPVKREFSYRLLVHVDESNQARLLQKAVLLWKSPAEPVVLATDSTIRTYHDNLSGQDVPIGRRLTAPAFAFDAPILSASGAFPNGNTSSNLKFTINLAHNDSLNPFLHRYHPDHNNLDSDFATPLAEGIETYSVSREITLHFRTEDPEGRSLAGWGETELGGTFDETVVGLMRDSRKILISDNGTPDDPNDDVTQNQDNKILASGYFRLRKISDVGQLDPAY